MKKVSLVMVAAVFAVTALSAKRPTAEQKTCVKNAVASKNAATKECKAKKGKEKAECMKSANASFADARKACMAAKAEAAPTPASTAPAGK
ncbi:MAG: hypothetical protein ACOY5B_07455 [Spirochaetota bacterium]